MTKGIAIALLVVGIILLMFGYNAYHSASSGISQAVTGAPTDKSIWLLMGGLIATILGGFNLMRAR
ncbi:MAG: DUF3185 family protein [Candidatus Omnitrophica bacterium]|nr:DUF3185 family protein [Candidatus Omnitrophota bacterium]